MQRKLDGLILHTIYHHAIVSTSNSVRWSIDEDPVEEFTYLFSLNIPKIFLQGIVIGYDHRKLGTLTSLGFARMCAAVFLSQGFKVYLLEGFVPTPFVAFAVSHLDCAGIV